MLVVCASTLLVVCASTLLVVLQFIARCVSFPSLVVCASALLVVCASALLVVCASTLLVVCASTLLVVLQCIARYVSFPSVVVCAISCVSQHFNFICASALQVMCGFAFLQCSCVCGSGVTALVAVIPRISQVVGGLNLCKG